MTANSKKDMNKGVIYCAVYGKRHYFMSIISSIQFNSLNPDIPITILSDQMFCDNSILSKYNITIVKIKSTTGFHRELDSRQVKTNLFSLSPYQTTLYLDTDILPLQHCSELWDISKQHDFCIVRDMSNTISECFQKLTLDGIYTLENYPSTLELYNSGVMLFNKIEGNETLFKTWHEEWSKYQSYDQYSLVRSIAETKTQVFELENRFNTLVNGNIKVNYDSIVFLHILKYFTPWDKSIQIYKTMSPQSWETALNILGYDEQKVLTLV